MVLVEFAKDIQQSRVSHNFYTCDTRPKGRIVKNFENLKSNYLLKMTSKQISRFYTAV